MREIMKKYRDWKSGHDEGYVYDEIHDFFSDLSRGELCEFMDDLDQIIN